MAKLASQAISDKADKYITEKSIEWSCPRAEVVRRILDGHIDVERLNARSNLEVNDEG